MGINSRAIDFGSAFGTDTVLTGVHALQCGRNIPDLRPCLVPERVNHFAVFQFLGAFLGVRVVTAPQVVGDPLEANGQLCLFVLELLPQSIV